MIEGVPNLIAIQADAAGVTTKTRTGRGHAGGPERGRIGAAMTERSEGMVEQMGIEPTTSTLRTWRSPD